MVLVSHDWHEAHNFVDDSAICDSAIYALEHSGVSFSRLIAEREFSTAIPSSPDAFKFLLGADTPTGWIPNDDVPGDIAAAHTRLV